MGNFEDLPVELALLIVKAIPDVVSLHHLITASSFAYRIFSRYHAEIFTPILELTPFCGSILSIIQLVVHLRSDFRHLAEMITEEPSAFHLKFRPPPGEPSWLSKVEIFVIVYYMLLSGDEFLTHVPDPLFPPPWVVQTTMEQYPWGQWLQWPHWGASIFSDALNDGLSGYGLGITANIPVPTVRSVLATAARIQRLAQHCLADDRQPAADTHGEDGETDISGRDGRSMQTVVRQPYWQELRPIIKILWRLQLLADMERATQSEFSTSSEVRFLCDVKRLRAARIKSLDSIWGLGSEWVQVPRPTPFRWCPFPILRQTPDTQFRRLVDWMGLHGIDQRSIAHCFNEVLGRKEKSNKGVSWAVPVFEPSKLSNNQTL